MPLRGGLRLVQFGLRCVPVPLNLRSLALGFGKRGFSGGPALQLDA